MWGKRQPKVQSEFFTGESHVTHFSKLCGMFKQKLSDIFEKNDMDGYTIPDIIVVGDESSGKSSLLENITKCPIFPRDTKYCTKAPIRVNLKHSGTEYSTLTYQDETILLKKEQIISEIDRIFRQLSNTVSSNVIEVTIASPVLEDMSYTDLPGLRSYPEEQAERTTRICEEYLKKEDIVVLCVIPSTQPRLTASKALALIQKYNKVHQTLLALTMVDRLQDEYIEELLIQRILRKSDEFDGLNIAGCVGVFSRSHSDIKTLSNHHEEEQHWFLSRIIGGVPGTEYTRSLMDIEKNISTGNLILQLSEMFRIYVCNNWVPKVIEKSMKDTFEYNKQLRDLGIESSEIDHERLKVDIIKFIRDSIGGIDDRYSLVYNPDSVKSTCYYCRCKISGGCKPQTNNEVLVQCVGCGKESRIVGITTKYSQTFDNIGEVKKYRIFKATIKELFQSKVDGVTRYMQDNLWGLPENILFSCVDHCIANLYLLERFPRLLEVLHIMCQNAVSEYTSSALCGLDAYIDMISHIDRNKLYSEPDNYLNSYLFEKVIYDSVESLVNSITNMQLGELLVESVEYSEKRSIIKTKIEGVEKSINEITSLLSVV